MQKQLEAGYKLALGVSYQGTGFSGWETQVGQRTVQHTLELALSRIAGTEVGTCCAGRTDAGVHAFGQVVHFATTVERPDSAWLYGVNALLPPDVAVQWVCRVADDFHARFSATRRSYRYLLLNRRSRCPLYADRAVWVRRKLCLDSMRTAAAALVGSHDFTSFRAAGCQARTPNRTVYHLRIERHADIIVFDIAANAFLQRMVRNIVGTLVQVGLGQKQQSWVAQVLAERNRKAAGATISSTGLYLLEVCYPEHYGIPAYQPKIQQF
ncbi:MAG: tRNA pseudouridine(38-40) synthase TruA [Candidatus Porifericomitaceae bacterium WSBS_2022_MAG_OTU9]